LESDVGVESVGFDFFLVFFFAEFLIEEAELLMLESVAEHGIFHAAAIAQESAVAAILAIVGEFKVVAVFGVHTFVAQLGADDVVAIDAIVALVPKFKIHTVLIFFGVENEVAVTAVSTVVRIFRIFFIAGTGFVHAGSLEPELFELFSKGFIEIEGFQSWYFVQLFVPFVYMEHGEGRVRPHIGYDHFSTRVAFACVEFAFIAETQTALEAIFRTQLRSRYSAFSVIVLIRIRDFKRSLAACASGCESRHDFL
jgi:hypothetical protein